MLKWAVACAVGLTLVVSAGAGAQGPFVRAHDAIVSYGDAPMDTTTRFDVRIPSLLIAEALHELRRQTGLGTSLTGGTEALRSAPVEGRFTSSEALRKLLEGTGLVAQFSRGEGGATITSTTRDGRAQELEAVIVRASSGSAYAPATTTGAMRTPTPLRDTPQAVTVISAELAADQGMQSLADVARFVPGVAMGQGEGHRDAPTIRGNASTSDFFVDGVRDDAQYLRDLYNVQRIEAVKGPNALIFGRGGGGGVINRVRKQARWSDTRELALTAGTQGERRATGDLGGALGARSAGRVLAMYESSDRFRSESSLERYAINPTASILAGTTLIQAGIERFHDSRTVDRGIPSFSGGPSRAPITRFFGDPDESHSRFTANSATGSVERVFASGLGVANRTSATHYDKFYQNVYPGAMNAAGSEVTILGYSSATNRRNIFNQTDLTHSLVTGDVQHRLLGGFEVGRQVSDHFRATGYFSDDRTSVLVPFESPTVSLPITFRQSASDQDARTTASTASIFVQDQIAFSPFVHAVVGIRVERFDLEYENRRASSSLERVDVMTSPRAALIIKPRESVSLYGSYSVSHLPSSGEQFASLTVTTSALEPERFTSHEIGAKWDIGDLALSAAAFRLDRTNTTAPDPADPARVVQTGRQRSTGYELSAVGSITPAWDVAWGYGNQVATITSRTAAAAQGRAVPLVPRSAVSIWNKVQFTGWAAAGFGVIHQGRSFAAIDNSVELPAFTRVDGGIYFTPRGLVTVQVNGENLLNERYYPTSHGNNNIMPGAPRSVRVTAVGRFR
jgi:catecholate siderophore receptor